MISVYILEYKKPNATVGRYFVDLSKNAWMSVRDHAKGYSSIRTRLQGVVRIVGQLGCTSMQEAIRVKREVQVLVGQGFIFPEEGEGLDAPASFIAPQGLLKVERDTVNLKKLSEGILEQALTRGEFLLETPGIADAVRKVTTGQILQLAKDIVTSKVIVEQEVQEHVGNFPSEFYKGD